MSSDEPAASASPALRPPSPELLPDLLAQTGAVQDGEPLRTVASLLCPVTWHGHPAMLKVTAAPEELRGINALSHWAGRGVVRVLHRDAGATIMERAGATLRTCEPDDAVRTTTLTAVLRELHRRPPPTGGPFVPLQQHLRALMTTAGEEFASARTHALELLRRNEDRVLLHGDVHADNLLASDRGWLFIDPKGVIGPRAFDHANIFTNWTLPEATEYFDERLSIVCQEAELERQTMLQWIVVWSAVSGIWHLQDHAAHAARFPHAMMAMALRRLH